MSKYVNSINRHKRRIYGSTKTTNADGKLKNELTTKELVKIAKAKAKSIGLKEESEEEIDSPIDILADKMKSMQAANPFRVGSIKEATSLKDKLHHKSDKSYARWEKASDKYWKSFGKKSDLSKKWLKSKNDKEELSKAEKDTPKLKKRSDRHIERYIK